MQEPIVESHPFAALLPPQATVMMMGDVFRLKKKKHAMQFSLSEFSKRYVACVWAGVFQRCGAFQKQGEKAFDADKIKAFLSEKGIASCPTVLKAIREHGNASDKFLKVIETVDLAAVLAQMPGCRHLCTTGGKATEVLLEIQGSGMKMPKTDETVLFPMLDVS